MGQKQQKQQGVERSAKDVDDAEIGGFVRLSQIDDDRITIHVTSDKVVEYPADDNKYGKAAWKFTTEEYGDLMVGSAAVYGPLLRHLKKHKTATMTITASGKVGTNARRYAVASLK